MASNETFFTHWYKNLEDFHRKKTVTTNDIASISIFNIPAFPEALVLFSLHNGFVLMRVFFDRSSQYNSTEKMKALRKHRLHEENSSSHELYCVLKSMINGIQFY